jgi:hypothetical protein
MLWPEQATDLKIIRNDKTRRLTLRALLDLKESKKEGPTADCTGKRVQ